MLSPPLRSQMLPFQSPKVYAKPIPSTPLPCSDLSVSLFPDHPKSPLAPPAPPSKTNRLAPKPALTTPSATTPSALLASDSNTGAPSIWSRTKTLDISEFWPSTTKSPAPLASCPISVLAVTSMSRRGVEVETEWKTTREARALGRESRREEKKAV